MAYQQGYRPPSNQTVSKRQPVKTRSTKASRKRRGRPLRLFLLLMVVAFVCTLGVMVYLMYDEVARVEKAGTFYPGVYVDGYSLNGVSPNDAYTFLLAQAQNELADWSIQLQYEDRQWTIDTQLLGLIDALDNSVRDQINKAYYIGREQNASIIDRYQTVLALKSEPYYGYTMNIEKDTSQLDSIIADIAAAVEKPATDARWIFDPERKNNPIVITPEQVGQTLDINALQSQIISMINNMEAGNIQIQPQPVVPSITASSLEGKITLIGSYESSISSRSTQERNLNIERGCQSFHGKEVRAGEKVSFNRWVGERTEKNGFYPAAEIVSGAYEMGVGGGICQVSSTLYNAVIQANLNVVSRTNHGIPVNYMEMGADATVSDGRIDFVFENNTSESIYLIARLDYSKMACVFQIYGRPDPDGNTYGLRHELVETIPIPSPTKVPDRKEEYVKYIGEEQQVTDGQEGYVVRTYLVTYAPNGNVINDQELYVDTYKAQPPKVYYGLNRRTD